MEEEDDDIYAPDEGVEYKPEPVGEVVQSEAMEEDEEEEEDDSVLFLGIQFDIGLQS
jgi:hypothetical protein